MYVIGRIDLSPGETPSGETNAIRFVCPFDTNKRAHPPCIVLLSWPYSSLSSLFFPVLSRRYVAACSEILCLGATLSLMKGVGDQSFRPRVVSLTGKRNDRYTCIYFILSVMTRKRRSIA